MPHALEGPSITRSLQWPIVTTLRSLSLRLRRRHTASWRRHRSRNSRRSLRPRARPTGVVELSEVTLLCPCQPGKIFAVGLNYKSHLGSRPRPAQPEIFYKPVTALQNPGRPHRHPARRHRRPLRRRTGGRDRQAGEEASREEARDAIFGVTCGNDVSERNWQHGATRICNGGAPKARDTFAPWVRPSSPASITAICCLQTRLNGEVVQKQYTADLIFDCPPS